MGNQKSAGSNEEDRRSLWTLPQKSILKKNDLEELWMGRVDKRFIDLLSRKLFYQKDSLKYQDVNDFAVNLIHGNFPTKAEVIIKLIDTRDESAHSDLELFLVCIFSSTIIKEKRIGKTSFKSWNQSNTDGTLFTKFLEYSLRLAGGRKKEYKEQDICNLLTSLDVLITFVAKSLFQADSNAYSLYPLWDRLKNDGGKSLEACSIITMEDILFLSIHLPVAFQKNWRLLFSTKIHGESFSRFSQNIVNQGPLLMIIKDKMGNKFGGFVSTNIILGPNFVGDASSFTFALSPNMAIHHASFFNQNFAYLNQGQQTMPNGFGMGGCLEYFGIWLDAEFGKGICNDSCTTFRGFSRLTNEKEFRFADVEVWGVGKPPATAEELGERSVLDGNSDVKALLTMAGKKVYSEGLREERKN